MTPKDHIAYRPEIDGLRAIAVLSVVLYHFGADWLAGGFVGVDIFFVISGYLIGGILWAELQKSGRVDLGRFYIRRVRRLAPAFFAVLAVSTLAAWFIMLPFEFRNFGKEMIASSLWLSNVLFYREAGYFDIGAENRVLLHTWSLSVEEQFYLVLPLCLLLAASLRWRSRSIVALLGVLWALSLIACIARTPGFPSATFYLFHYRAWELLTGVLLAIILHHRGPLPPRLSSLLAICGLVLIVISVLFVDSSGFPGWQAILPVAGTAAVIWGTSNARRDRNPVAVGLSWRGLTFFGLISYSLYLWHWPVLTLSRYARGDEGNLFQQAVWLIVVLLISTLSWRYVEQPVRFSRVIRPARLIGGALLAGVLALSTGALMYVTDGLPGRFGADTRVHITASAGFLQDRSRCAAPSDGPLQGIVTCAIGPEGPPGYLIWGDSHLRALMDGLAIAANEADRPGMIIWHAGCPSLFGLSKTESAATPDQDRACSRKNQQIQEAIPQLESLQRVLLVDRWTYYAEGQGTGLDAHNEISLSALPGSGLAAGTQAELYAAALEMTVAKLRQDGLSVWLLRQVPELPDYASQQVARDMALGRLTAAEARQRATVAKDELTARVATAEAPINRLVRDGQISLIDPWPRLCASDCSGMQDGKSLYFDNNHLTYDGAVALRDLFLPFLSVQDGDGSR